MTRRIAALDLDGTLLTSEGSVSPATRAALRAWIDAGNLAVVVTARPARAIGWLADQFSGIAICSNGTATYQFASGVMETAASIEPAVVDALIGQIDTHLPEAVFSCEYGFSCQQDPTFPKDDSPPSDWLLTDMRNSAKQSALKFKIHHPNAESHELIDQIAAIVGDGFELTYSTPAFVEVSPAGVTKARALEAFCAKHEVETADVIAFGDMPNDIAMLSWAGIGVAMANSDLSVLAIADQITKSNDEDGVAAVLQSLI